MNLRIAWLSPFILACAESESARTIELTPRVMIAGVGDSVDLYLTRPVVSARGWVAARRNYPPSDLVAVYDSTGSYVQTIGRAGGGPGELRSLTSFGFGPGDSLWVIDGSMIVHVFEPPPGTRFVRSFRFERPTVADFTPHGILVQPSFSPSARRYVHPRLLSWNGEELSGFAIPDTGGKEPRFAAIALAGPDLLWIGPEGIYEMMLLGKDGTIRQRITRQADWFPEDHKPSGFPWVHPPKPRIHSISVGPDGLLWVLVRRAHRNWEQNKSRAGQIKGLPTPRSMSALRIADLFEGVVEVFDPVTGNLLASRDVGGGVVDFVRPGMLCELLEDESGAIRIQLWNVKLVR